ncbi:MAG: response regulator [Desulfobulbaceae bacterium]|nr:response regulator [Desulfobulbaceae bacterium]
MGKLLLVEDNILLQETTKELLEAFEHQVFTASNGQEAREVMVEHSQEIDLILLDLTLPDISGDRLLAELARDYPGAKVVLCTGSLVDDHLRQHPAVKGFLAKPFDLGELRKTVEQAMAD